MDAVGALRLSPLRRGLAIDSTVDIFTFYVPHRHVYGEQWIKFMKDGVNATPLPTVNTTGYIDHAAFLGTINPDTNKIPKHLFQGYLNIYNNYFKPPWMPDRTEANPNELNQDDARYGFRCCHLKNIWTGSGNRCKVMPEQHKLRRRNIIVSIFKSVRGSGSAVVQRQHFSGNERAVVAIGDRVNAKRTENCGEGIHTRLLPSGNSISGRTCYPHP